MKKKGKEREKIVKNIGTIMGAYLNQEGCSSIMVTVVESDKTGTDKQKLIKNKK